MPDAPQKLKALTKDQADLRDKKCDELEAKIADKAGARDRLVESQKLDVQRLQAEIDDLTMMRDALDNLP